MKLLIVTQKVNKNDPILGFFHRWLEEFSKHCQSIIVICLEKGECNLPSNIKVLSLGKENSRGRIRRLVNFYKYIRRERKNYESVFVHMNPEYVILGGLFWRFWGKKISLWYTHKSVNLRLRIAAGLSHLIFTASLASFRLPSKKVVITGHGIDTDLFQPGEPRADGEFKIISVGRLSATKNQFGLVKILASLLQRAPKSVLLELAGVPIAAQDEKYWQQIGDFIFNHHLQNKVEFLGALSQKKLVEYYQTADLLVNLSQTGSLDKDVLEAAACNLDILTTNEAYKTELPSEYWVENNEDEISQAIIKKIDNPQPVNLRPWVCENHSLEKLINKIINHLKND